MQNIDCQSCKANPSEKLYTSRFSQALIRYALWNSVVFSFIFAYYFAPLKIICYVLLIFNIIIEFTFDIQNFQKLKLFEIIIILVLIVFIYSNSFSTKNNIFETVYYARFYLGFIFTYLFFKLIKKAKINSLHLFVFSAMSLIEPIFSMLGLGRSLLSFPHYVILSNIIGEDQILNRFVSGNSFRPLGPALNTSVSGTLSVIILFFCLEKLLVKKTNFKNNESLLYVILLFTLINSIFYMSTTSYLVFFLYFTTKMLRFVYRFSFKKFFVFLFASSALVIILSISLNSSSLLNNPFFLRAMSLNYIDLVLQMKAQEFTEVFLLSADSLFSMLFGIHQGLPTTLAGHSQLLNFFRIIGIIPATLVICLFISKIPPSNKIYVLLLFAATFHYQVIFSFPGQIITGALLANKMLLTDQKTD